MDHSLPHMDHRASARKSFPRSRVCGNWLSSLKSVSSDSYPYYFLLEACTRSGKEIKRRNYIQSVNPLVEDRVCGDSVAVQLPKKRPIHLEKEVAEVKSVFGFSSFSANTESATYNCHKKEAFVRPVQTWANDNKESIASAVYSTQAVACHSSSFRKRGQVLRTIRNRSNSEVPVVRIKPMIRVAENNCDESIVKSELDSAKHDRNQSVIGTGSGIINQKDKPPPKRKSPTDLRANARPLASKGCRGRKRTCSQRIRCCSGHAIWGPHRPRPSLVAPCSVHLRYGGVKKVRSVKQLCYFDRLLWKRMKNGSVHKRAKKKLEVKKNAPCSPKKEQSENSPKQKDIRPKQLEESKSTQLVVKDSGLCFLNVKEMSPNDTSLMKASVGKCADAEFQVPPSLDCVDSKVPSLADNNPSETDMPVLLPSFAVDCDDASVCSSPEMPTLTPFVDVGDETAQDGAGSTFSNDTKPKQEIENSLGFSDDSYVFPDEEDIPYFPTDSCDNFAEIYSPEKTDSPCLGWWLHNTETMCKRTARKSFPRILASENTDECAIKSMKRIMPERRARKSFCESCDDFHSIYRHVNHCTAEVVSPSDQSPNIVQYVNNPRYQPVVLLPKLNKENGSSNGESCTLQSPDNMYLPSSRLDYGDASLDDHGSAYRWVLSKGKSSSYHQMFGSTCSSVQDHPVHRRRRTAPGMIAPSKRSSPYKYSDAEECNGYSRKEPIVDVIDGLEFLSFHTEDDLRDYVLKSGSKMEMSFRFSEDSTSCDFHNGSMESTNSFMGMSFDELDASRKEFIVPTKTKDITKIKGWKNKHFASKSQDVFAETEKIQSSIHLHGKNFSSSPLTSSPQNKLAKQIPSKLLVSPVSPSKDQKGSNSKTNNSLELSIDTSGVIPGTISELSRFSSPASKDEKSVRSAFVSDILDDFLKTKSELKIDLLSKYNPNINPPAADSKILSVGSLRKTDDNRSLKRSFPFADISRSNSRSSYFADAYSDDESVFSKRHKYNVHSDFRTFSDVSRERHKNSTPNYLCDLPNSRRKYATRNSFGINTSSWETISNNSSPANTYIYSQNSASEDSNESWSLIDSDQSTEHTFRDAKFSRDLSSYEEQLYPLEKKNIQLIRHTLWSKDINEDLISDFCQSINCSSEEELEEWRNSVNWVSFTVRDISKGLAQHALSAMGGKLKPGVSVIQTQLTPKPVKLPPKCQFKSKSHSSNIRLMKHVKLPLSPTVSHEKSESPTVAFNDEKENTSSPKTESENGCISDTSSQNTRSKRSIRLPARYLDSALLVVGSEWVSPGPAVELEKKQESSRKSLQDKKNDESKVVRSNSIERKASTNMLQQHSSNSLAMSGDSRSTSESEDEVKLPKVSCARTSEYIPLAVRIKTALSPKSKSKKDVNEQKLNMKLSNQPPVDRQTSSGIPHTNDTHVSANCRHISIEKDEVTSPSNTNSLVNDKPPNHDKEEGAFKTIDALCNGKMNSNQMINSQNVQFPNQLLSTVPVKAVEQTQLNKVDDKPVLLKSQIVLPTAKNCQTVTETSSIPTSPLQTLSNATCKSPVKVNFIVGSKVVPLVIRNAIVAKSDSALKTISNSSPVKPRILAPVIISPPGQVPQTPPGQNTSVKSENAGKPVIALNILRTVPSSTLSNIPSDSPAGMAQSNSSDNSLSGESTGPLSPTIVHLSSAGIGALAGSFIKSSANHSLPLDSTKSCEAKTTSNGELPVANPSVLTTGSSSDNDDSLKQNPRVQLLPKQLLPRQTYQPNQKFSLSSPSNNFRQQEPQSNEDNKTDCVSSKDPKVFKSLRIVTSSSKQDDDVDIESVDVEFDAVKSLKKCHNSVQESHVHRAVQHYKMIKLSDSKKEKASQNSRSNSPCSSSNETECVADQPNALSEKTVRERERRQRLKHLCNVLKTVYPSKVSKTESRKKLLDEAQKYIKSIQIEEKDLKARKELLLAHRAKLHWQYKKLLEESTQVTQTCSINEETSTDSHASAANEKDNVTSPALTATAEQCQKVPVTKPLVQTMPLKTEANQSLQSSQSSSNKDVENCEKSIYFPLSHIRKKSGTVILRFTGTKFSSQQRLEKNSPMLVQSDFSAVPSKDIDLNKVVDVASRVIGPCIIKQVRLKTGKIVYTYSPSESVQRDTLSSNSSENIPTTSSTQNKVQTSVTETTSKMPSLDFSNCIGASRNPESESELLRYLKNDIPLKNDASMCSDGDVCWDQCLPESTACLTNFNANAGNKTSLWMSDSGEPCIVKRLSPDEGKTHHLSPEKPILPSILSCSSISEDEFLSAVPKCTVSSSAS